MAIDLLTDLVERAARSKAEPAHIAADLKRSMPVNIQNVADYLFNDPQEVWDFHRDFPNIAPPWPLAFFSWTQPRVMNSNGKIIRTDLPFDLDYGLLANTHDLDNGPYRDVPPGARWGVETLLFLRSHGNVGFRWLSYFVDGQGEWLSIRPEDDGQYHFRGGQMLWWPSGEPIPVEDAAHNQSPHTILYAPFLALSFAHCKNVTVNRAAVPPKVLKKRISNHGWSPEAWHALHIQPMQKVLHDSGASTLQHALHICRGHFKDYREGRGLFGKVHGMFWWDFRLKDASHPHSYDIRSR